MISEMAIARPGYSHVQTTVQEALDLPAGMFFQLLDEVRELRWAEESEHRKARQR